VCVLLNVPDSDGGFNVGAQITFDVRIYVPADIRRSAGNDTCPLTPLCRLVVRFLSRKNSSNVRTRQSLPRAWISRRGIMKSVAATEDCRLMKEITEDVGCSAARSSKDKRLSGDE
jgi:hypothetical protein